MKIIRPATLQEGSTSFSRASTAWLWDKTGTLVSVGNDVPRWAYDPSDLTKPPSLLIENVATNMLRSSQYFGSPWSQDSGAVTVDVITAPDGTVSGASYVHPSSTSNYGYFAQTILGGGDASLDWVYSFWVKVASGTATIAPGISNLTIATKTSGQQTVTTTWTRVFYAMPAESLANTSSLGVCLFGQSGVTYHIWGAQLERGSLPSSYIQTTSTAVTRAADVPGNMLITPIIENDYSAWSSTTIYVTGDRVMSTATHRIYESVAGQVYNVKITSSASGQIYNLLWPAHGLVIGEPLLFTGLAPSSVPNVSTSVVYYVNTIVDANNFTIRDNSGNAITATGAMAAVAATRASPNYGIDPTSTGAAGIWIDAGPTNKYAVFDKSISTQSSAIDCVNVAFLTAGNLFSDSVVVQNISGSAVRVALTSLTDGVVYDQTTYLNSQLDTSDYYSYCFEPTVRNTDVLFSGLPPYLNAVMSVSVTGTGETVKCGLVVWGQSKYFGPTQAGMSLGILDYSVKSSDTFGYFTLLERAYSKTMTLTAFIKRAAMNNFINLLNSLRATPTVYIGDENLSSSFQYGFYKDYSVGADYPEESTLHIEIESLT